MTEKATFRGRGRDAFFGQDQEEHELDYGDGRTPTDLPPIGVYIDAVTLEEVRSIVRQRGGSVTFVRLTDDEKLDLARVIMAYKEDGLKTTENEIGRIAIAIILADYHQNKDRSILDRAIKAIRS